MEVQIKSGVWKTMQEHVFPSMQIESHLEDGSHSIKERQRRARVLKLIFKKLQASINFVTHIVDFIWQGALLREHIICNPPIFDISPDRHGSTNGA